MFSNLLVTAPNALAADKSDYLFIYLFRTYSSSKISFLCNVNYLFVLKLININYFSTPGQKVNRQDLKAVTSAVQDLTRQRLGVAAPQKEQKSGSTFIFSFSFFHHSLVAGDD